MQSHPDANESPTDENGVRRLARGVQRSWRAIVADLEPVDSGSLDVLLYCPDDLVVRGEAPLRRADRAVER